MQKIILLFCRTHALLGRVRRRPAGSYPQPTKMPHPVPIPSTPPAGFHSVCRRSRIPPDLNDPFDRPAYSPYIRLRPLLVQMTGDEAMARRER